jgi:hypothetical protein
MSGYWRNADPVYEAAGGSVAPAVFRASHVDDQASSLRTLGLWILDRNDFTFDATESSLIP